MAPRGRLLPNDFEQPFLFEHFSLLVLRVRKAVGIHHQDVSFRELQRAGLIRDEIEHPQEKMIGDELFDRSRGGAEQADWIMSRADEVAVASRAQEKEKQRHVLFGKRFF